MKYNLYHSSFYNLRMILSPHLLYDEENYIKYIDYTFTPITERDKTSLYLKIDYNLSMISSYLIFNILNSLFVKQSIVKKDMEEYYNSENLHIIKGLTDLSQTDLPWLGNIPPEALIELREQGALEEIRNILGNNIMQKSVDKLFHKLKNVQYSIL